MPDFGLLLGVSKGGSSLLNGLVGYWPLEEASGTRVDATGRGNDLTSNNSVGQAAGKVGNCATFVAASSQSLSLVDNADLSTGDVDFTVACWVNFATTGTFQMMLSKGDAGSGSAIKLGEYFLYRWTDGFLYFDVGNGTVSGQAGPSGAVSLSAWHFVVGWHDSVANTVNLQVDNGTVFSTSYSSGSIDTVNAFRLGASASTQFLNGSLDEVGFWRRILTAGERTSLWNAGAGRTRPFAGT